MRYDDIEVFKSIYADNQAIQVRNEELISRFEKLPINKTLKYINFKVIGGSFTAGLLLGALAVSGYSHYRVVQAQTELQQINASLKLCAKANSDKFLEIENLKKVQ